MVRRSLHFDISLLARFRAFFGAFACLLFVATWPGSGVPTQSTVELRPIVAPPLPRSTVDRDGALEVAVTDGEHPIAGARVSLLAMIDGQARDAGHATTDAGGHTLLTELPRAEHLVVVDADGRARASRMVVIVSGARHLDVALASEHSLDVVVKDEQGAPLAAELEVRYADALPMGARVDASGRRHVGHLGEGPYVVRVRAPGYEETTRRRVAEGEVVLTLGKQGAFVVRVIAEDGKPAVSAKIAIASPSLWPPRSAETGADGTVRIGGLDRGSYAMRATRGSRVSPIEVGLALGKGEERPVELRLAEGVNVAVKVTDAVSDEGITGARVTLAEGGLSPFPFEGVTDRHGDAVLGPIARGGGSISARADGYVAHGALLLGETETHATVKLLRGGTLVGKVTDSRGFVVDGATVRIVGTDLEGMPIDEDPRSTAFREAQFSAMATGPSPLVPAGELGVMPGPIPAIPQGGLSVAAAAPPAPSEPWVTGRGGVFRATNVTPGRVRALVTHPQYVEGMSDIVAIGPDGEADVTVVLARGGTLEGRVVDGKGRVVAGAHVTALAAHGSLERMNRTATDGSFAFASLPPDVILLVARDEDVTQIVGRLEVSIPDGGKKYAEIVIAEDGPALAVRVTGDRGAGVDAAQISATSLDAQNPFRATSFTDSRGEAELRGGRGIALRVEVRAPGRAPKIVVTSSDMEKLVVALPPAETVTGEIVGRRESIEGAEIAITTEAGVRHGRSNKDGVFTIGELAPGPARVGVHALGRAPVSRDVVIAAKDGRNPTEIGKIELAEEGIVEGVVVDGRGRPVAGARVGRDGVPTYLPVGQPPPGTAVADARGHFHLAELPEGDLVLEAYAPDVGRGRLTGVHVRAGRTKEDVKIVIVHEEGGGREPIASGGVAVTLGETAAGLDGPEVVLVAVAEGSEAERAGLLANDIVVAVGGTKTGTILDCRARLAGPVHDDVIVRVKRGDQEVDVRVPREPVRR